MSKVLKIPENTAKAQSMASDPKRSAWVSANAGSGKTYVLTQRVIRLMLDGCDPSRILCLTFTKAAAAEMSNRVFKELGIWSTLDEKSLAKKIAAIEDKPATKDKLIRARQLFSKALETPGGLKIQTIHAFCEALLHQFPIEANVPGYFSVMDTPAQINLINEAKRAIIIKAHDGKDLKLTNAFATILDHTSDDGFAKSLDELIAKRDKIGHWLSHVVGQGSIKAYIYNLFDLAPDETEITIAEHFKGPSQEPDFWQGAQSAAINLSAKMDQIFADTINDYFKTANKSTQIKLLKPILFTKENSLKKRLASKALKESFPLIEEKMIALASEIEAIEDRLNSLKIAEASTAFFTLADDLLGCFEALKKQRGLLDFEDLIIRTANLLQRSDARAWVQYKLDRGIDHILIDEAQDTSPRQWEVINALIDEFYAGLGGRDIHRTVFAVGDEKQSIYSFQGAEPDAFADQRDRVARQANQAERKFEKINLALSFRSTRDVLSAVDKVFERAENYSSLGRDAEQPIHETIRQQDPGCVDLWPIFRSDPIEMPEHWAEPVDHLGNNSPIMKLAENIAEEVKGWLANGEQIYDKDKGVYRLITAGDVNILVRSRTQFTTALVRAFRKRAINVAGADKLVISEHIAVKDLIALGQVMVMSDDDLSLAAILKSPLFNHSEDDLFKLAYGRENLSLRQALAAIAKTDAQFSATHERLNRWSKMARHMPVYEFFAQILSVYSGRKEFSKRFGSEVHDVLDAFLLQALNSETIGLPGLEAFLSTLVETAPEIKREQDLEKDEIRIMTVHASKGLEAPIVFLVDHGAAPYNKRYNPKLVALRTERNTPDFIWLSGGSAKGNKVTRNALDEIANKAEAEYQRLLYVGMTRAADRLILCGYSGARDQHASCWYNVVQNALSDELVETKSASGLDILRWQKNTDIELPKPSEHKKDTACEFDEMPQWINKKLPSDPPLPRPLTPSGAALLLDEFEPVPEPIFFDEPDQAGISNQFERGQVIHILLQYLPDLAQDQRILAAQKYLQNAVAHWSEPLKAKTLDLVMSLLALPELQSLFDHKNSRTEVALTGTLEINGKLRMINGQIDRLIEYEDRILIIDYKSNQVIPTSPQEVPKTYQLQMALYHHLLSEIYPQKQIESYLLWTNNAHLMKLPVELLQQALLSITKG